MEFKNPDSNKNNSKKKNEENVEEFTFAPPLYHHERLIVNEQMAIIGNDGDIEIKLDDSISNEDYDDDDLILGKNQSSSGSIELNTIKKKCDDLKNFDRKIFFSASTKSERIFEDERNDIFDNKRMDKDNYASNQMNKSDDDDNEDTRPMSSDNIHNKKNRLSKNKNNQLNDNSSSLYERFSQWIYCIAVVNFDIEIGQSIECIFPEGVQLTEKEITNICYLSFPDSNSGCMGDTQFYFRTKTCPIERPYFDKYYKEFNSKCLPLLEVEKSYFYGFVYFRQVKDRNARRGYFQKSLVILTWFPFVSLFSRIIRILAPQYFDYDLPSLEAACSDINRWPPPKADQILNLPLFGALTQVLIPGEKHTLSSLCQTNNIVHTNSLKKYSHHPSSISLKSFSLLNKLNRKSKSSNCEYQTNDEQYNNRTNEIGSLSLKSTLNVANDVNIYRTLMPVIAHIQLLWELVLTNEPIAVITQTPNVCSEIVTALVNLIAPLRYGADYRPFFTIHDSEFKEYTSYAKSPPPVILGVTNPFFVKTLQEWPHLIKINEFAFNHESGSSSKKTVDIDAGLKMTSNKSLEMKTGVYTKYKPFLQKDREILKKLLKGIDISRPSEVQNIMLRRFLVELTQSFSIPLERYFASLMPLAKNLSPFKRPPKMHHFQIEEFISSLDATGPHLTSVVKGDWTGLYRRFLRSPNFVCWYSTRLKEAHNKIRTLHLETISDSNLANLLNDKPEIELVDLILKLKENLKCASNEELNLSSQTIEKIQNNMDKIINKLPEDSRSLFEDKSINNNKNNSNGNKLDRKNSA